MALASYAQTKFESGNYTDINGKKHDGLIKNYDWKNNPTSIIFKTDDSSKEEIIESEKINRFEILGICKFVKFTVEIDKSSLKTNLIDKIENPVYNSETALLKVIVDGKMSLYKYEQEDLIKFFYGISNETPTQLFYKKYLPNYDKLAELSTNNIDANSYTVLENNNYKKQLYNDVNCDFERPVFNKLNYEVEDLKKYFIKYNECKNFDFVEYKNRKAKVNIKPSLKLNYYNFELEGNNTKSDKSPGIAFGAEFEIVLPYNNNKISLIFDPNYNMMEQDLYYTTEKRSLPQTLYAKLNYINIPIGIRYNMYLNENSKISITPSFDLNYGIGNSNGFFVNEKLIYDFNTSTNYGLAVGYSYKKYFIELKMQTKTNVFEDLSPNEYKLNNMSLAIKYQLF